MNYNRSLLSHNWLLKSTVGYLLEWSLLLGLPGFAISLGLTVIAHSS